MTTPQKRNTAYEAYFGKVLAKRLSYVNNVNAVAAVLVSISLKLPYGDFWVNLLHTLVLRAPLLYAALYTVKLSREYYSSVDLPPFKTLGQQIARSVLSQRFLKNTLFYVVSANLAAGLFLFQLPFTYDYYLLSKEYLHKSTVNDEWVYFWFYAFHLAAVYSLQHSVFGRDRLSFKYGVSKVSPDSVLWKGFPQLFGNSVGLNIVVSVSAPIFYIVFRSVIYKANWLLFLALGVDHSVPSLHIHFKTLLGLGFFSFHVIFAWEVVNHVYNIYATIGCLDGTKPISSYSADPINTLLSGLRNIEPQNTLSRLTAFQELAYISTAKDAEAVKLRAAIYNAHTRTGYLWPAILDECSLVIKETCSRINYRSKSDLKKLQDSQLNPPDDISNKFFKPDGEIFGNSSATGINSTPRAKNAPSATPSPIAKYYDAASSPNDNANFFDVLRNSPLLKFLLANVVEPARKLVSSSINPSLPKNGFLASSAPSEDALNYIGRTIQNFKSAYATYREQFLSTNVGVFFRITVKRDTESRVINPVNYGNAVIAISNLLIHSIEEDKKGTIDNSQISEVLNLLERPVRASSNYTDVLPASVYLSSEQRRNTNKTNRHLIALLHDLTMKEFFNICVKFNYRLNDLLLSSRAFKLAKWVIDVSIAQQQQEQELQNKTYLNVHI